MIALHIHVEKCKGCALCAAACPKKLLYVGEGLNKAGLHYAECKDQSACVGCRSCGIMCPDGAIVIERI